jgi:hypothetical protein
LQPVDAQQAYRAIVKLLPPAAIVSQQPDQKLEVINEALVGLLINLRNRFFHFTSGHQDNISIRDVNTPNDLFVCVNPVLISWLAAIYFETLARRVELLGR